jgi:transcriptional regulator with XRE-family HTH domain
MCSTRKRLAALLREQRIARGLSLRQAADSAGIAPSTLSRWEAGSCLPRVPELESLLRALTVGQQDIVRILASLDAPRAAKALRCQVDESLSPLVAPSGGALLRALRSKSRLSVADVAEFLGVSASTVSRWEACASHPSRDQFAKLLTRIGASEDARRCLVASGVAKLKVSRTDYCFDELTAELARLERNVESGDDSAELHLLQLQSMLWWFRDNPGASGLLQKSTLLYADLLLKERRFKEALHQAQKLLDSGLDPYGELGIRAHRIIARSDVYRWEPPRPHLGLFTLEPFLSRCGSRHELSRLLLDMSEFSFLAGRYEEGREYERQSNSLSVSGVAIETRRLFTPIVRGVLAGQGAAVGAA